LRFEEANFNKERNKPMAVQTTYPTSLAIGRAGQAASMVNWNTITRLCETAAGIAFGLAVTRGTGDKGAVLGGSDPAKFLGISLEDKSIVRKEGETVDKFRQYDNMPVCNQGEVFVKVASNVAAGDYVYFDTATGELTNDDTDVGPVPGAMFESAASSGGIAKVSLGIPRAPIPAA
jgi:hypothetical protein